ncbi:MAG TPA: DNA primase [Bryobacteraceae bacterium]|nr:DNA primase [Bryobacteraceae bacterium]
MDFKEQLKSSISIEKVVGEYVRLKKAGGQRYVGLCPFHNEKTPSFGVHVVHQIYKCFGCGAGGDVIDFVMKYEGISFYEALKSLAERNGIPMPKRSLVADEDAKLREAVFHMHELAGEQFRANLQSPAGEAARSYLAKRGMAPETVEQFGMGYAERGGRAILRVLEQRFSSAQIEQSGLVRRRDDGSFYDYFRNRLMFPIHNESGKIIGFGGRALAAEDNPKYLNSPETPIYKKSYVLYNLHRAKDAIRKEDRAVLVEGYMDAIGVTAAGFRAVVASCGTSLTAQQVQALKRLSQRIVVNFDPDAAGASGSERSINLLLEEGMSVRIMELDGGLDPDEYCKERGAAAYEERLKGAQPYFYWLADRARKAHDVRTTEGVVAVLKFLMPAVERISDRLERMAIANDVAGYIGVERGMVLDSFRKAVAERRQEKSFDRPKVEMRADERMLLNALFLSPELCGEILPELKSIEAITRFSSRRIFQTVFAIDASGGRVTFEEVNARLEEADQNLLAEAVLREDAEPSREEVLAAVGSMRRTEDQQNRVQLKLKIREAERAGNWEQALRFTEELQRVERAAREPR